MMGRVVPLEPSFPTHRTIPANPNNPTGARRDDWSRTGAAFIPHPAGAVVYGGLLQGNAGLADGFFVLDVVGLLQG